MAEIDNDVIYYSVEITRIMCLAGLDEVVRNTRCVTAYGPEHFMFKKVVGDAYAECEFEYAPDHAWAWADEHYAIWGMTAERLQVYLVKYSDSRLELIDIYSVSPRALLVDNVIMRLARKHGAFVVKVRGGMMGNLYALYESHAGFHIARGTKPEIQKIIRDNEIENTRWHSAEPVLSL